MGVDLIVVALLAGVSGLWLLAGLLLVVLQLGSARGGVSRQRQVVGWLGAGLIALLVIHQAWSAWNRPPDLPEPAAEIVTLRRRRSLAGHTEPDLDHCRAAHSHAGGPAGGGAPPTGLA
jgi:hypothetical protein